MYRFTILPSREISTLVCNPISPPNFEAMSSVPSTIGYSIAVGWPFTLNCVFRKKGSTTVLPSSSIATPSMVKPLSPYFCWSSIIQGISVRQGSHQVAQKFTSTTFPFRLASGMSLPARSLNVTSGSFGKAPAAAGCRVLDLLQPGKFVATTDSRIANNRPVNAFLISGLRSPREPVQKCQFTRKPGQPVDEHQSADCEQQHAAEHLDGVQVPPEALIKTQKPAYAERR